MVSLLSAILAAVLAVLGFPPIGFGFLVVPAAVLLLWAIRRAPTAGVAAASAAGYGVVFFGALMWWVTRNDELALLGLILAEGFLLPVFGWFVFRRRETGLWSWTASVTGAWALMEVLRSHIPVGGLQWGGLGYALAPYGPSRGAASFIGAGGWTLVIVMTAAVAVYLFEKPSEGRWLGVPVLIWAVLLGAGAAWPAIADGPELQVTIVQGNTPCGGRERCAGEVEGSFANHLRLTQSLPDDSADLVVWGESSSRDAMNPVVNPVTAEAIGVEARRIGSYVVVGGNRPTSDDRFVNTNMFFGPDGSYIGEYYKQHPVPFGEYVPWRPVFGLIPATDRVPRDMVRGDGPVVFDLGLGSVGSVISFEGSFARYTRDHIRAGAELMIVATNERSFGVGPAADQLIDMTRMHAAEHGVDLVQAAITGKSAIVSGGEVIAITGLYTEAIIDGTVRFRSSGPTLATLWGDWVAIVATAWLVISLGWSSIPTGANRTTG